MNTESEICRLSSAMRQAITPLKPTVTGTVTAYRSSGSIQDPFVGGAVSGTDLIFPTGNLIVAEPQP
jgi:hypothetical protein